MYIIELFRSKKDTNYEAESMKLSDVHQYQEITVSWKQDEVNYFIGQTVTANCAVMIIINVSS